MQGNDKINNVVPIQTSIDTNFFNYWLLILKPFHKMTEKEMEIAATFLKKWHKLSSINDIGIINRLVMSEETKREIRSECNTSKQHFHLIMKGLREKKFIIDNKINQKFIPKNISKDDKSFKLLFYFDLDRKENTEAGA